jgi:hypothetical protein
MLLNAIYFTPKNADKFFCVNCDFKCCKQSDYDRHENTRKHQKAIKCYTNAIYLAPKSAEPFICTNCNKEFMHASSMYRHKNKCTKKFEQNVVEEKEELVSYLMKENGELKQMILDVCKNMKNDIVSNSNTINNNHVNSHNKTFNLQFFLNETCKDAMNITDFIDSIQLQLSDLENVGKLGYVNGISKIIINKLNALEETKRPIHCTDPKREIIYVKDENIWKKDNDNNKIYVKKIIKRVAFKNCKLIPEFREKHPDCNKYDSRYADQYNKMVVEAMGGAGDNDAEKEEKIIKNIAKEVQINKGEYLVL